MKIIQHAMNAGQLLRRLAATCSWLTAGLAVAILAMCAANSLLHPYYAAPTIADNWDLLRAERARAEGVDFDSRTWREIWKDCGYTTCLPFINPLEELGTADDGVPIAPWPRNSKAILCNETGKWLVVDTDRYGFTGNDPRSYESADIVLIGDSYVHGACVEPKDSIGGRMRAANPSVLNLGVSSQQPLGELAIVKEFLPRAQTLIWFYSEVNDHYAVLEPDLAFLKSYLQHDFSQNEKNRLADSEPRFQNLLDEKRQRTGGRYAQPYSTGWLHSVTNYLGPLLSFTYYWLGQLRAPTDCEFDRGFLEAVLTEARRFGGAKGVTKFIFVYLPGYERYSWQPNDHPNRTRFDRLKTRVLSAATSSGWDVVDIDQQFSAAGDPMKFLPFRMRGHYTPQGYELVVQALQSKLDLQSAKNLNTD